ncbi:MOP flippase family protein [Psychroflexus sediminis]|uniref:Polysaccharide transporter, PST family n=1 Tax=Psychroflexus sediminis TaxID=470826 RepID=A0A1G7UIQ5_9FLAO|nr:MOP flippase family protein [Psychroflexus sediminis]SDG47435.1 polysaccharide transporter, PST family [Psychroflexus sediminis]
MSLKKQAISGVKWSAVSTITVAIVSLLKISVLARFLKAEDFGLMALVSFVLGFMNLFMDMGLTSAILHKQNITNREYASLYWINIIFSMILFGLISLSSFAIAFFYDEPELKVLIPIMAISIILSALGKQFKTIEQKNLNFKYIALTDIIGAVFGLGIGLIMAIKGYGVKALVYAALTQYAISNTVYFIKGIKDRGMIFHFNYQETKFFLKIGIYQVGGQIVNYVNRDLDILLVGKFFGAEILGGYSLAKQLVQRPMQILNPIITQVASPVLSLSQDNKNQLKARFLKLLNIVATLNFSAYSLLAILAYPIVFVLYGSGFTDIYVLVQILSVYMFLRSVLSPVGSLVIATGKTYYEFYWNLLVLIITPILIYMGAQLSIEMVALSLVISILILMIPSWKLLVKKLCNASMSEYFNSFIPKWGSLIRMIKAK